MIAFLENRFQVAPDVSAMAGRVMEASRRLSAGLATWVPRLTVPSGLIRVVGTADSGKTQLALRLLRDADQQGLKASYICFNRALADHMARVAPVRTPAETFHEYAVRVCRRTGVEIDFGSAGVFDRIAAGCIDALEDAKPDLDLLVLDEGQDLQPEWVQAMLSRLRPEGCIPCGIQRRSKPAQIRRNRPFRDSRQDYLAVDDDLHGGPPCPSGAAQRVQDYDCRASHEQVRSTRGRRPYARHSHEG